MGITYGGESCIEPSALFSSCLAQEPPVPTDPWHGAANNYKSPLGMTPGSGLLLLRKSSLDVLDLNRGHELVMDDGVNPRMTLKTIVVRRHQSVCPGLESDTERTPHCVWITDKRWVLRTIPIDKAYNIRDSSSDATTTYYSATRNSGPADWTWATMFQSIWNTSNAGLGSAPSLPFTPSGTPEGFDFYGSTVWIALQTVLARLACALRYDPFADTFSVVQLGATDTVAEAVLAKLEKAPATTWDERGANPVYARLPAKVRVLFLKVPAPSDGSSTFYSLDVADTAPLAGALTGSVEILSDDLPALYTSGSLTNSSALSTRATERAADWFRKQKNFNRSLMRVYDGWYKDAATVVGKTALVVQWEDRGQGMRTEIAAGDLDEIIDTSGGGDSFYSNIQNYIENVVNQTINNVYNTTINKTTNNPYDYPIINEIIKYANLYGLQLPDWHYFRHVSTDRRFYNPWPVEYDNDGGIYVPGGNGQLAAVPYLESRGGTIDRIGVYIRAPGAAGAKIRLGIYKTYGQPTDLWPSALLFDAGEMAADPATEGLYEITINQVLQPSTFYYLAIQSSLTIYPTMAGWPGSAHFLWSPWGVSAGSTGSPGFFPGDLVLGYNAAWVRGLYKNTNAALAPLPATFPTATATVYNRGDSIPKIFVRYSA